MKQCVVAIMVVFSSASMYAQDAVQDLESTSSKEEVKKNSIGFNFFPFMARISSSTNESISGRWYVEYQRTFTNDIFGRIDLSLWDMKTAHDPYVLRHSRGALVAHLEPADNDSVDRVVTTISHWGRYATGRVGIGKQITPYFSVAGNLIGGQHVRTQTFVEYHETYDSSSVSFYSRDRYRKRERGEFISVGLSLALRLNFEIEQRVGVTLAYEPQIIYNHRYSLVSEDEGVAASFATPLESYSATRAFFDLTVSYLF